MNKITTRELSETNETINATGESKKIVINQPTIWGQEHLESNVESIREELAAFLTD